MSNVALLVGEGELAPSTAGQVHVYRRDGGSWSFDESLAGTFGDQYGEGVSTDGPIAIVAAPTAPAVSIHRIEPYADCNGNGLDDACDIASGLATGCRWQPPSWGSPSAARHSCPACRISWS